MFPFPSFAQRQLSHYTASNRANALKSIGTFFSECQGPERFIAIVIPNVMELVLDEELKVREALITLLKSIWVQFPSSTFSAVQKITITYINSGLTSLVRGKTSMYIVHCTYILIVTSYHYFDYL